MSELVGIEMWNELNTVNMLMDMEDRGYDWWDGQLKKLIGGYQKIVVKRNGCTGVKCEEVVVQNEK